jgi:hypothetical protein
LASATLRSEVPPRPTPTMVGGRSAAGRQYAVDHKGSCRCPSAGMAILRYELFSEPRSLGIILTSVKVGRH